MKKKKLLQGLHLLSNPTSKLINIPNRHPARRAVPQTLVPNATFANVRFHKSGFPIPSRAMNVALKNVEYINYLIYIIL